MVFVGLIVMCFKWTANALSRAAKTNVTAVRAATTSDWCTVRVSIGDTGREGDGGEIRLAEVFHFLNSFILLVATNRYEKTIYKIIMAKRIGVSLGEAGVSQATSHQ